MKVFLVFAAVILSAQGRVGRQGWGSGWSTTTTPPPTTTGWSEPPPTESPGWGTPPPGWSAPPPGWGPPPPGWNAPTDVTVDLAGSLSTSGQGWAASDHSESITAQGDDGTPAEASVISVGEAYIDQYGSHLQVTNLDASGAQTLNSVTAANQAIGQEGMSANVNGLAAGLNQHGHSVATGAAATAADATSDVTVS